MIETDNTTEPLAGKSEQLSTAAQRRSWFSRRWPLMLGCLASVAWCFVYAAFRSQLNNVWIQQNGGGVPYTVFWILLVAVFWPSKRLALRICIVVVLAVCGLEFFQLYNPEPLATFRRTRFGAALLGSTFVWNDIPPYFIGGAIGWVVLKILGTRD